MRDQRPEEILGTTKKNSLMTAFLCLATVLSPASLLSDPPQVRTNPLEQPRFPLGVWYEGGVGAFRHDLIPEDPELAAPLYLRNFRDIAARGCDTAVVPNTTPPHHKPLLDAAQTAGIKLIIELGHEGGEIGTMIRRNSPNPEALDRYLRETLVPIARHPALLRVQLLDEPWPELFDAYGTVARQVRSSVPGVEPFCCVIESANIEAFLKKSGSDVAAFDCYPIGWKTPVGDRAALERLRRVATEAAAVCSRNGVEAWAVLQCHSITNVHRFPTPAEVRCMTHLALAAGCRGIFWFLYQTEWWNRDKGEIMAGLVDEEYRERPIWREIGLLTREIRRIEPVLRRLCPIEAPSGAESDGSVHWLRDEGGGLHAYVVNMDVTRVRLVRTSIPVPSGSGALVVARKHSASGGASVRRRASASGQAEWTVSLPPGGGALFHLSFK